MKGQRNAADGQPENAVPSQTLSGGEGRPKRWPISVHSTLALHRREYCSIPKRSCATVRKWRNKIAWVTSVKLSHWLPSVFLGKLPEFAYSDCAPPQSRASDQVVRRICQTTRAGGRCSHRPRAPRSGRGGRVQYNTNKMWVCFPRWIFRQLSFSLCQ